MSSLYIPSLCLKHAHHVGYRNPRAISTPQWVKLYFAKWSICDAEIWLGLGTTYQSSCSSDPPGFEAALTHSPPPLKINYFWTKYFLLIWRVRHPDSRANDLNSVVFWCMSEIAIRSEFLHLNASCLVFTSHRYTRERWNQCDQIW